MPQGVVPGPDSYFLHTNDIPVIYNTIVATLADDAVLFGVSEELWKKTEEIGLELNFKMMHKLSLTGTRMKNTGSDLQDKSKRPISNNGKTTASKEEEQESFGLYVNQPCENITCKVSTFLLQNLMIFNTPPFVMYSWKCPCHQIKRKFGDRTSNLFTGLPVYFHISMGIKKIRERINYPK